MHLALLAHAEARRGRARRGRVALGPRDGRRMLGMGVAVGMADGLADEVVLHDVDLKEQLLETAL